MSIIKVDSRNGILRTMLVNYLLLDALGITFYLFILWRRLKEDYSSAVVFSLGFIVLISVAIGQVISYFLLPDYWFWLAIMGVSTGLIFSYYRYKFRIYETLDAFTESVFPWLLLIFLFDSVHNKSVSSLGGVFVILSLTIFYYFINSQYKKFTWYKSGKVGISGLLSLAIFFLLRGISGFFVSDMLTFAGRFDLILSLALSFFCFLGVYHLSRLK